MVNCKLATLLAERRMNIEVLARQTGLSRTTISALVNNKGAGIHFATLDKLCRFLEVTPNDLLEVEDAQTNSKPFQLTEERVREIIREEIAIRLKERGEQEWILLGHMKQL